MGPKTAGELRDSVRIQRRLTAEDGYGNKVGDWKDLFAQPRRCRLTPTRGGEAVIAQRAQGTALFDCWLRFDEALFGCTTDDRAIDERNPNRTFNIKFVQDMDGDRRWLLMQLELGTADG
jgi:head-tail adaptor